jgi:hypothetical protein
VSIAAVKALDFGQFVLAVLVAALFSMWVYWHASRHGSKHATAWGVATFLAVGIVLPVYFIRYYVLRRRL